MSSSPLSASVLSTASTVPAHRRSGLGYRFSTLCTTVDNPDPDHKDRHGSSSVPIYQSATFKGIGGAYDYSRSGNPTRTFLEYHVAKLAAAKHAFAVSSGMGALDVILRTLQPGDEIIAGNDLYGGSNRLLTYLAQHSGIVTHHVDTTDPSAIRALLSADSRVRIVLLESPTNPLLQIVDIDQIARDVKAVVPAARIVVDNTMMSPYLMRPLELGADIVYDSGTKYLSGHHDLMAGLVATNSDEIASQLAFMVNSIGNGLAAFDCFLLLRGIKTLAIRLDRQQASAVRVAEYLDALGFKVNYPGLPRHPGKDIHDRLADGPGAVLSFETGDKALSEKVVSSARLWAISVSFGCVNSLISMPCLMSHASIDPAVRAARNLPEDLIRLCVGIEDCDDLLEDLQASLIEAGAIRVIDETCPNSGLERVTHSPSSLSGDDPSSYSAFTHDALLRLAPRSLLVSAPGKIILFGEHAVVYGKKALAAAVDLRCYCLVEPSTDQDQLTLSMPDSNLTVSWPLTGLPFQSSSRVPDQVDAQLSQAVLGLVRSKVNKPGLVEAAHAFLYLYLHLAVSETCRAQAYTIRSALPVGAGLGSSAAYSVSLATALLYTHAHLQPPTSASIEATPASIINAWAFLGEKILHGNPSGVDNTVATYGGAIGYRKAMSPTEKAVKDRLAGFSVLDLLVTDTRVSRDTRALVSSVAHRRDTEPDYITSLLADLERLTLEAETVLTTSTVDEVRVGYLMKEAHQVLCALGVGHEALDKACNIGEAVGVSSKLTGAGGGGCAITLLPSGFQKLDDLRNQLKNQGFDTYLTKVGGKGLGICIAKETEEESNSTFEAFKKKAYKEQGKFDDKVLFLNDDGGERKQNENWRFVT